MKELLSRVPGQTGSKALAFLILTAVLWSMGGLLIKLIEWNPLAIAGARSLIAAVMMLAYRLIFLGKPDFRFSTPRIGGAVAYVATVVLFVSATKMTTAANAILLQYTAPAYIAVLGAVFLNEKTTRLDWLTIALAFGGMGLFFLDRLSVGNVIGNIFAALSGLTFSVMVIFLRAQKDQSPLDSLILGNILTALVCLPFYFQGSPGWGNWGIAVLLGVFQLGLSYIFYSEAIRHVRALDGILVPIVEPILNPLWVLLFLGEVPGPWAILGGFIVLGSVAGHYLYTYFRGNPRSSG